MKKTHRIITISPFTYLTPSIKNISFIILAVLLPQVLMLFFTKSYKSHTHSNRYLYFYAN